jgi:hypothetical protein
MSTTLKSAAVAIALAGASFVGIAHAQSITFSTGNVAIGYSDGYWDRSHAWHTWAHEQDRTAYQAAKNAEYHDWKHDRDKDMGWHERHY